MVFSPSLQSAVLVQTSSPRVRGVTARMDTSGGLTEPARVSGSVLTTITATGQNTSLLRLQTGAVPGKLAALTLVAGTREESVVWSLGESKRASGAKVERNGLHHDKTSHFQLH